MKKIEVSKKAKTASIIAATILFGVVSYKIGTYTVNKFNETADKWAIERVQSRSLSEDSEVFVKEVPVIKESNVNQMAEKLEAKTEQLLK